MEARGLRFFLLFFYKNQSALQIRAYIRYLGRGAPAFGGTLVLIRTAANGRRSLFYRLGEHPKEAL
jgi:hypothetical protein